MQTQNIQMSGVSTTRAQRTIKSVKVLSPEVLKTLCRLCLEEKQTRWSFFSMLTFNDGSTINISNVFHYLTGEDKEKMENPILPPYICEHCLGLLSSAYSFQQKYEESTQILTQYLAEEDFKDRKMITHDQHIINKDGGIENIHDTEEAVPIEETEFFVTPAKESSGPTSINQEAIIENSSKIPEKGKIYTQLHRCPICPQLFTALELKRHCATHQALKSYLKSAPKYIKKIKFYAKPRTENNGLFNQKMVIHACPFCQEEFESEPFRDHIKQHRIEGNFRCNVCNRIFLGVNHLKMHQLSHKKEAPFKCKFCKKTFFLKSNFDFHLLNHSDIKELPFKCEYCEKTFSNPEHLKRHKFAHENDLNYNTFYKRDMLYVKCTQCQQKFKTEKEKADHTCKTFCAKCRKLFDTKSKFKSHVCKTALKISQCSSCCKVFELPSSFKTHKFRCKARTLCYVCGKNVANITQHLSTHYPNKRPNGVKCAECNKRFNYPNNLKRHVTEVHLNIVRFQCQYCAKGFKGKWNLQVHERIHHGKKNHVCNICNKRFLEKSYLRKHLKVHLIRDACDVK